ncbi:hypothetical protein AKO1_002824 [Acrasis kona]|uniref:Intermembrane lipid transfer protein VPS13-like C-terminal domain-containing protein n=1 Tax=Acrasis kona TaxID=1008807 RepID=A0AAW2YTH8_9EUKA
MVRLSLCRSIVTNRVNTNTESFAKLQDQPTRDDDQHSLTRFKQQTNQQDNNSVNSYQSVPNTVLQEQLEEQPHLEMDTSIQMFPYVYVGIQESTLQLDFKLVESLYTMVSDLLGIINNSNNSSIAIISKDNNSNTGVNAALEHIDNENQVDTLLLAPVEKQAVLNAPVDPVTGQVLLSDPLQQNVALQDEKLSYQDEHLEYVDTVETTTVVNPPQIIVAAATPVETVRIVEYVNEFGEFVQQSIVEQQQPIVQVVEPPSVVTTSTIVEQPVLVHDDVVSVNTGITQSAPRASTTGTTTATGAVSTVPTKLYFDKFILDDIRMHTTFYFDRTENPRLAESNIYRFLEALGMTLINIDDAPLQLNHLTMNKEMVSSTDIQNKMIKHYTKQGLKELYKVLGSLNIIGNPLGLVKDIKSGVKGMVKKPVQNSRSTTGESSIESEAGVHSHKYHHHKQGDTTRGISKGGKDLFKNTLHGAFKTVSRVSYSLGRGISYLTLDRDYNRRKEREMLINKANTSRQGLSDASDVLVGGFVDGVTGIYKEPRKVTADGGDTWDMIKGVGRGIIGIPTKPITGIVDFTAKATEGLANGLDSREQVIRRRRRVRYPRTFREDGAITTYEFESALGQYMLYAVNDVRLGYREQQQRMAGGGLRRKGLDKEVTQYAEHEHAIGFTRNKKERDIYLLTNLSIIKISLENEKEKWRVGLDTITELNYNEPFQIITLTYESQTKVRENVVTVRKKITTDSESSIKIFWTRLNGAIAEVVKKKREAYEEAQLQQQQQQQVVVAPQSGIPVGQTTSTVVTTSSTVL